MCIWWFYVYYLILKHFILILYETKKNLPLWIYETLTDPCEKHKVAYFTSSRLKNIPVSSVKSKFTIKIFYWIALGSTSSACCSQKSLKLACNFPWNKNNQISNQLCINLLGQWHFFYYWTCSKKLWQSFNSKK